MIKPARPTPTATIAMSCGSMPRSLLPCRSAGQPPGGALRIGTDDAESPLRLRRRLASPDRRRERVPGRRPLRPSRLRRGRVGGPTRGLRRHRGLRRVPRSDGRPVPPRAHGLPALARPPVRPSGTSVRQPSAGECADSGPFGNRSADRDRRAAAIRSWGLPTGTTRLPGVLKRRAPESEDPGALGISLAPIQAGEIREVMR